MYIEVASLNILNIKTHFSGWSEAGVSEYRYCYKKFGGNFSTHPDVLDYLHSHAECRERFFVRTNGNGELTGALCVWHNKYLANDYFTSEITKHLNLPVPKDELILPLSTEKKSLLPFKGKIISEINASSIMNVTYKLNARRQICLAKNPEMMSSSTKNSRKREVRRFLEQGGEIIDQREYSASELVDIYFELFKMRRGVYPGQREENIKFIQKFRSMVFGSILFYQGKPAAFQLIMKSDNPKWSTFDYINIGLNTELAKLSVGTIIMWLNTQNAWKKCNEENKAMRFSFGKPTYKYKDRWCIRESVGRLLFP
ncbi:GNAT family N-acetyltransferase [Photorhabdus hindustanensis]|uniref:GNAT family N-acetyltransferase n=1 Tax=Photorhabdus hindustanensis TaxID=2918802 RepID=A0A2S8QNX4_9GAMM|nr:GNAT family N-acetyltransferase [Photorhabdus hindustanensis]PQQ36962.1 GNAT family N-acetyltransferase [Photorhabdus luminescens]